MTLKTKINSMLLKSFPKKRSVKKVLSLILIFKLCILAPNCFAKEITVAFGYNKPPFSFGENEKQGLEIDLFREALRYKGHTLEPWTMPSTRVKLGIKMGADAVAAISIRDDGTYYSDEFVAFENIAISKKKHGYKINTPLDLKGKIITAFPHAYIFLGDEFNKLFSPDMRDKNYYEIHNQLSQNKMFWLDRTEVIILDKTIFMWYRKQLSNIPYLYVTDEVIYHNIFPNEGKSPHFCSFKNEKLRDDFNEGLRHIREAGIYQKIVDKYTK